LLCRISSGGKALKPVGINGKYGILFAVSLALSRRGQRPFSRV